MNKINVTSSDISQAIAASNGQLAYTPSEENVRDAVIDYLKSNTTWVQNAIDHDAAVNTKPKGEAIAEVLKYQGLHALAFHKLAHTLYTEGKREGDEAKLLEARNISQGVRRLTAGIEIHPGASIGTNCFIDHGSSLVIGETAEIGNNVFIYHGVTLGATDGTNDNGGRRHPTIGNDVTISNGVQILGAVTVGNHVKIGAGAKIIGNDIVIPDGTVIAAGVEVRHSIKDKNQFVSGSVPYIPGITPQGSENLPIFIPKRTHEQGPVAKVEVEGLQWYKTLVSGLQNMLGGAQPSAL